MTRINVSNQWIEPAPVPKSDRYIECYVSKVFQYDHVALRFECYNDLHKKFQCKLKEYYETCEKLFVKEFRTSDLLSEIYDSLIIFRNGDDFFRAKIVDYWGESMFYILLIDEGFHHLAHEDDLFICDEFGFLEHPYQGQVYRINLEDLTDVDHVDHKHLINCALKHSIMKFSKFVFEPLGQQSKGEEKIKLYGLDGNEKIYINDVLLEIYKENVQELNSKSTMDEESIDEEIYNYPTNMEMTVQPLFVESEIDDLILMKVKKVYSPGKIYLKFVEKDLELMSLISKYNPSGKPSNIEIGQIYAVKKPNNSKKWTRTMVMLRKKNQKYHCCLIDSGLEIDYDQEELFDLSEDLKLYPPRSVWAVLDYIKPASSSDEWDDEKVNEYLRKEIIGKTVYISIIRFDVERQILYCLMIFDEKNIADMLVSKNYAIEVSI